MRKSTQCLGSVVPLALFEEQDLLAMYASWIGKVIKYVSSTWPEEVIQPAGSELANLIIHEQGANVQCDISGWPLE